MDMGKDAANDLLQSCCWTWIHHVLGQWPGLAPFFGQLISTFRCFAVGLAPKCCREIADFFFFCKLTVPVTCAAVKVSYCMLQHLFIHFLKKNNPPSLFKSLPSQRN